MSFYIRHEDLQTPENGVAFFGPFKGYEMTERLNDAFADILAQSGNVDEVELSESESWQCTNDRVYWFDRLTEVLKSEGGTVLENNGPCPDCKELLTRCISEHTGGWPSIAFHCSQASKHNYDIHGKRLI